MSIYRSLLIIPLVFLVACAPSPEAVQEAIEPTQTVLPSSTVEENIDLNAQENLEPTETPTSEPEVEETDEITGDPCKNLGEWYEYNEALGEIKEDYIGSWHSSPFVGSGYTERFVFFPSGSYLFFPSQYECGSGDESCVPSPIEQGIWGVQGSQINLAREGNVNDVRSISIGEVIDSSQEESPYPLKTTIDGIPYWLMSKDTNLWNPETGESCD